MESDQEFFEHYRFVADKGQEPLRVDKFLMNDFSKIILKIQFKRLSTK